MNPYFFSILSSSIIIMLLGLGLLLYPNHYRHRVMGLFFLAVGFLHSNLFLFESGLYVRYHYFIYTHLPVAATLGPLAYLFILGITENKSSLNRYDIFHFLPAIASLTICLPFIFQPPEKKIQALNEFLKGEHIFFRYIILVSVLLFSFYIIKSIISIWKRINRENPAHKRLIILIIILLNWIGISLTKSISILSMSFTIIKISNVLFIINVVVLFLLFQRYSTLFLYGTLIEKKTSAKTSYLTKIDTANLERELNALLSEEKFYCDEDLTLNRLSDALDINSHQLSEFINDRYKVNFNTFINRYRINESKHLLLEHPQRNTLSIAYAVGFNSYSTFYNAFKTITGISPAAFRKQSLPEETTGT